MIAAARIQRMTRLFDAHIIVDEETLPPGGSPRAAIASSAGRASRASGTARRSTRSAGSGSRWTRLAARVTASSPRGTVDETTILIVDDEPRVLDALEAILAAEFRVLRAGHGEEALARLAAEPDVAVIVTDHRMPGMTGVELLRRSQEHDAGRGPHRADRLHRRRQPDGGDQHRADLPLRPQALGSATSCSWWCGARPSAGTSPGRTRGSATSSSWPTTRSGARRRRAASKPPSFDALVGADSGLRERGRAGAQGPRRRHDRAAARRDRHRQGAVRPAHPRQRAPPRAAVRRPELRRPARDAARVRAVRPRAGRLHRRHRRAQGPVRGGRRRHDLPRRGRRDLARRCSSGSCACCRRARSGGSAATTTRQVDVRVIAATNADLEAEVARRPLPARPLLPPQRVPDPPAAPARAARGHPRARGALPAPGLPPRPARGAGGRRRRRCASCAPTRGRATCASWRTRSSARWRSPTTAGRWGRPTSPSESRRGRAAAAAPDAQRGGRGAQAPDDRGRAPGVWLEDPGRGAARSHPPEPPADAAPPPVRGPKLTLSPRRGGWWRSPGRAAPACG